MSKLNPYFEANGKTYEIKRTRALECEYEKITQQSSMSEEDERNFAEYIKLQTELNELSEKLKDSKDTFFEDVTNKDKKEVYLAFKGLFDDKYKEMVDFGLTHKDFSTSKVEEQAYTNGKKLLFVALEQQYNLTQEQSSEIWEKFEENLGLATAKEWILFMVQSLFENDEEEENPFLKQAKERAIKRAEQRKGLLKMKK
ncbi:MAG: hypothetical protein ACI4PF_01095 [Christensenellales bacterium]